MWHIDLKFLWAAAVVALCFSAVLFIRYQQQLSENSSALKKSKSIRLDHFAEHYKRMSANSNYKFLKEYKELFYDKNLEKRSLTSILQCNKPKNRYFNVLPYEHSRFKLQTLNGLKCSDYINANYLPGFNSPREFIATQGPLESTTNDFWRMVWESDTKAIVMLTRLEEGGYEKCYHYWPTDKTPTDYDGINVTVQSVTSYPDWKITDLSLEKGDELRVIRHFHFLSWPDFSVPSSPELLTHFVRMFRDKVKENYPVVVHCSAGVGRTGTFITLDRLLHQIDQGDRYVDIFGMVQELRDHRFWMVQKPEQYFYLHQCILKILTGRNGL